MKPLILLSFGVAAVACAQVPRVVTPTQMGDRTGTLKVGDVAPDFDLKVMHKESHVVLSSFRNKRPVALVFGSYT